MSKVVKVFKVRMYEEYLELLRKALDEYFTGLKGGVYIFDDVFKFIDYLSVFTKRAYDIFNSNYGSDSLDDVHIPVDLELLVEGDGKDIMDVNIYTSRECVTCVEFTYKGCSRSYDLDLCRGIEDVELFKGLKFLSMRYV